MSDDLIKRSDAIYAVMNTESVFAVDSLEPYKKTKEVVEALEAIPSADSPSDPHNITYINALKNRIRELEAKRPQGEWIWGNEKKSWHKCSVCGEPAYSYYDELADDVEELFDFCPNCGARMKGADDE